MNPVARSLTCILLLAAAGASAHASFGGDVHDPVGDGTVTARPTVAALRVADGSIVLDGRLDESVWTDAELAGGFMQHDPERGAQASERTTFRVLYDDDAVYFGVACFERDPSLTSSALSRRDNIRNSDMVSVYVDPYHDRTTGYNFRVNPEGVLADMSVFADGRRDPDWNSVWDAAVHRDATGWFVEMRIPFSAIRYQPGDDRVWGLQVYRWMHGRGEDTGWATWDRDDPGFVSRFGTLTGLSGLKASRQLEITPYVVGGLTDHAAEGDDDLEDRWNLGADVKYAVSANMTLQATVQPDFGQVEADPSLLNLSPFETYYDEKRPFFIEGSRFFDHRAFDLFYSRRIGTGDENARIRFAGKLIGKTAGDVSVAALAAVTDITDPGEAWNALKSGHRGARYGVLRLGKESDDGDHRIHLMQTAVVRDAVAWEDDDSERMHRDGYASGLDFELKFLDRRYEAVGSFVRTVTSPHDELVDQGYDRGDRVGSGGFLSLAKVGGDWRYGLEGRWESDRLDPNDAGRLTAADEVNGEAWADWRFDSDGEDSWLSRGSIHAEYEEDWLYAGSTVLDPDDPSRELWSYDARLHSRRSFDVGLHLQSRDFWSFWGGVWLGGESRSKYATRDYDGRRGPLMRNPAGWSTWWGVHSDWRRALSWTLRLNLNRDDAGGRAVRLGAELQWRQSDHLTHAVEFSFRDGRDDAQWVGNYAGDGIGDVDYVFGRLDQRTWDLVLRTSVLFDRDSSLELYLQPFLTTGDYSDARALARPDSYEFTAYDAADFDVRDNDFSYVAWNMNLVYRREYRPGSTFYLVWSHSRDRYDDRGGWNRPGPFRNDFDAGLFFDQEPENVFLTKLTYWFSI